MAIPSRTAAGGASAAAEASMQLGVTAASSSDSGRRPNWVSIWRPSGLFASSRIATLVAAAVAADLSPGHRVGTVLTHTWDTGWYLELARHGYPSVVPEQAGRAVQSTLGFFPLYPLTVRAVHHL